jgi:hypothetical protein
MSRRTSILAFSGLLPMNAKLSRYADRLSLTGAGQQARRGAVATAGQLAYQIGD